MSLRGVWVYFFIAVAIAYFVIALSVSWHPPVGVYIGFLAFLGVAVPLIRQREGQPFSVQERAFWTGVMALLVLLEIGSIYKGQREHDKAQAKAQKLQLDGFQEIGDGLEAAITQSQNQFDAETKKMGNILTQQNATLTQTMGGVGFPMFRPMPPIDKNDGMWPVLMTTPGKPWEHGHIPTPMETAPLVDVTVDISEILQPDLTNMTVSAEAFESQFLPQHYNLGTITIPQMRTAPFKLGVSKSYRLLITTRRMVFAERIYFDRDEKAIGGWRVSECVSQEYTLYGRNTVTSGEKLKENARTKPHLALWLSVPCIQGSQSELT
jgi:hypothetical protein